MMKEGPLLGTQKKDNMLKGTHGNKILSFVCEIAMLHIGVYCILQKSIQAADKQLANGVLCLAPMVVGTRV